MTDPIDNQRFRQINEELRRLDAEIVDLQAQIAYLEKGAEPFWMQNIRIAQRRIEAQRVSQRPADLQ